MSQRISSVALAATTVLLLASCGGDKKPATPTGRQTPQAPTYDKATCLYQPQEGDKALYENLTQSQIEEEPAFGKKYDRMDLEAIANSSAVETSFYVMDMGVELLRIPRTSALGCPTYYVLNEASPELRKEWTKIAGNGGEGQLAGLYFENCTVACPEFDVVRPTIIVYESSDRWTLVHESIHHSFNVGRKADQSIISTPHLRDGIQQSIARVENLYAVYGQSTGRQDLKNLALELEILAKLLYEMLVRTSFEEMAVENLLLDEYVEGRLKFVAPESAQSAVWYISYARKDGMKRFDAFRELFQFITVESNRNSWDDVLDVIARTRNDIDAIAKRTKKIEEQAQRKAQSLPIPTFDAPLERILEERVATHMKAHAENAETEKVFQSLDRLRQIGH